MNFDRISQSVDVARLQQSHVAIVGGGYGLAMDLARCGVKTFTYIDFDIVDDTNPARQDFAVDNIGRPKVDAIEVALRAINPAATVHKLRRDFCSLSPAEIEEMLGPCDLLLFATDRFVAQARGNLEAIRLAKPAVWIGLYRGGRAGEIAFTRPIQGQACYRCIASARYEAFYRQAESGGAGVDIPSRGAVIMDLHIVDGIAAQIAVGLLTAGADNRFGRLIDQLGDRNFIQVKLDPTYKLGEPDVFESHLGTNPAQFAFNSIALAIEPDPDCTDCARKCHIGCRKRRARELEPCPAS